MSRFLRPLLAWAGIAMALPAAANDSERRVESVRLAGARAAVTLKGTLRGRQTIDYQVRGGADQRLTASLRSAHAAAYFNVLPAGSVDRAMFIEGAGDRRFAGSLPDDGVYTVRVYLVRAAARRGERAHFALSLTIDGRPLAAISPKSDAVIPGTRFHAQAMVDCVPEYSAARQCEAWVVRRGRWGTATVELRWEDGGGRRILFIRGEPQAADSSQPLTFTRYERGVTVRFGGDERFDIPEALVSGG